MRKIDIAVPAHATVGGASYRLLSLTVSVGARSLWGSFDATVAGDGTPHIGDRMTVSGCLADGLVTATQSDSGAWRVSGEGAGCALARSTPGAGAMTATTIGGIIAELAAFCGLTSDVSLHRDPLPAEVDARSLLPEGTCADAILHLAGLCGSVAVAPMDRPVVWVRPARPAKLPPPVVLAASGETLDTDGYATGVAVTLNRRGVVAATGDGDDGETPSLRRIERSGVSPIVGGSVAWRMTYVEPLGIVEILNADVSLPEHGIEKTITGRYDYRIDSSVSVRGGQEQHVWRYGMRRSEEVEETKIAFDIPGPDGQTERARGWTRDTRTVDRTFDARFSRVDREEELERHESDPTGTPLRPVPFSRRVMRSYTWDRDRRGIAETEERYEEADVGRVDYVTGADAKPLSVPGVGDVYITLPQYQSTDLVLHRRTRFVDEGYDDTGRCMVSVERSNDDRGMRDLLSRGLVQGEAEIRAAKEFLLSLPRRGEIRVSTSPGGSALPEGVQYCSVPGRRVGKPSGVSKAGNRADGPSGTHCPYILDGFGCGVSKGTCSFFDPRHGTPGYERCRHYGSVPAEMEEDRGIDAPPVFGLAGGGALWHETAVYIDTELRDDVAQSIARAMAENILHVRQCSRGVTSTATIPLTLRLLPDGGVTAVSHDMKGLRTTVTWAPCDVTPPEAALITRMSSLAAAVFGRESLGRGREAPGRVAAVSGGEATVLVAAHPVQCDAPKGLAVGDAVLVYLPPGSTTRGRIRRRA